MIRHWLRLIWNRKRANFLIMVEIFISFLVLEGVMLMVSQYAYNYRHPLGYTIDNVWVIRADPKESDDKDSRPAQCATFQQMLLAARDLPEIEAAAGAFTAPYVPSSWGSGFSTNGHAVIHGVNQVTQGFRDVYGLNLVRGRWFTREDEAGTDQVMVINQRMAHAVFGDADPVGRIIPRDPPQKPRSGESQSKTPAKAQKLMRVIGVVDDFRQHGEYAVLDNYAFYLVNLNDPDTRAPQRLVIKVKPGTTIAFEEKLVERLRGVARGWSFEVKTAEDLRSTSRMQFIGPALALSVVAGFLLLMVALGLTGVVWQNVTQRVHEIGLRRAKGARIEDIHRQILGELAVMTSVALFVAVLLVVQMPLLPLPATLVDFVNGAAFVASVVLSVLIIYALTIGCGWYPARLATRIQPAEALHYE